MGPDNAVHAGPWRLLNWPRQTPLAGWAQDIRVAHAITETPAIELVDGPWSCAKHEFRGDGLWLDLTLVHVESGRAVAGTFDMEDGVWAPSDGSGQMTVAEFHRAYAGNSTTIAIWPADPFKDIHAPSEVTVRSPDGQFLIDLTTNQWRMSDWICPPRIVHIPTGEVLLDLKTTNWDGRAQFGRDGLAQMRLRAYPAVQDSLTVELDLAHERYRVVEGGHTGLPAEGYIDELQRAIGRSAEDLDELGVTIDVRASRRGVVHVAPTNAPMTFELEPEPEAEFELEPGPEPAKPANVASLQAASATPEPLVRSVPAPLQREPERSALPAPERVLPSGPKLAPRPAPAAEITPEALSEAVSELERMFRPAPTRRAEETLDLPDAEPPREALPPPIEALAPGLASIRSTIEAIEAEVTRQRLNTALHYEMIVLGVIRAVASGITRPADAVSILQTLAARRADIGPRP